jgi:hypothetical protein
MWSRLPEEMRSRRQWVIAGADKTPLSVDQTGKLYAASSVAPEQWLPFDIACAYANHHSLGVGFVLSKDDPYSCIDFDVKDATNEPDPSKHTHPDAYNWFWEVAQRWDSFTEVSRNGKGLHVWVKGKIGEGRRRFPIEVYSQERYIICTGNVVLDRPLADRQEWLNDFVARYLSGSEGKKIELEEIEPVMTDEAIWAMARDADNSYNFTELCSGRWQQFGHPSQSEADLALMSMFTFYSKSNEQCRRMFRQTVLGQREKAQKDNRYLNLTLITIRSRQAKESRAESNGIELSGEFLRKLNGQELPPPLNAPELATGVAAPPPPAVAVALAAPVNSATAAVGREGLPWPPGFVGHLAQFIYDSAPRPVKEVAIVGALGLVAGITAKAWYIPNSGLNVYMILVAQSAVGKEAMHSGVSALVTAASNRSPSIRSFVEFSDFASGPALIKACAGNTCFVNVCGEWGHKLKRIAHDDGRDAAMASLRMTMTNLYQKSGPQSIVGGITYSNKDTNIASVSGVAYSMIGETTPKTFYTSLTESMMEDGFLSRFIIVEYNGDRPALNPNQQREPSAVVTEYLGQMASAAQGMLSTGKYQPVNCSTDAATLIYNFEQECDEQINSTRDESWRQMWNRASLKVMRVSGLLAVADNYIHPCIDKHHVEWALGLIRRDISVMRSKLEQGDVGVDDSSRENKAISVIKDYFMNGVPTGYGVPAAMRENGIFPHMLIQKKCQKVPAYTAFRGGSTEAVKQVLRSLTDSGYIMEVQKDSMVKNYNFHGKCYRVLKLPDFEAERFNNKR